MSRIRRIAVLPELDMMWRQSPSPEDFIPNPMDDFIEIEMAPGRGPPPRIRQAGLLRYESRPAIDALETVLYRLNYMSDHPTFQEMVNRRVRTSGMNHRQRRGAVNISQALIIEGIRKTRPTTLSALSEDQVWPLFTAVAIGSPATESMGDHHYTADGAKEYIDRFRDLHSISKAHWKWICSLESEEMIAYFLRLAPYNIKLTRYQMMECSVELEEFFRNWGELPLSDAPTRILNKEYEEIHPRELRHFLSDVRDAVTSLGFDGEHNDRPWHYYVANAKNWGDLRNRMSNVERSGERVFTYGGRRIGRSQAYEIMRRSQNDSVDAMNYMLYGPGEFIGGSDMTLATGQGATHMTASEVMRAYRRIMGEKPVPDGPFEWCKDFPQILTSEGFTAHLLCSKESVIEEGQKMAHCLGRTYIGKIHKGEYMAFHIVPPEGIETVRGAGLTCGLKWLDAEEVFLSSWGDPSPIRSRKKVAGWRHDQTRGYRNDTIIDDRVDKFIEWLQTEVNKHVPKKEVPDPRRSEDAEIQEAHSA